MNCQDIASILDDRHIAALNQAHRDEVTAHLHACDDCARDWAVQQRLSTAVIPPMPAALVQQCRMLVAAQCTSGADTQGRRRTSRLVLIGSLAAVAAAAALLNAVLRSPVDSPSATTQVAAAVPLAEAAPVAATVAVMAALPATRSAQDEPESKVGMTSASPRYTVVVLPMQDRTRDEPDRIAVQAFYAALVNGLRAVPGLTLRRSDAVPDEIAPGEFYVTVAGDGPVQGRWNIRLMVKARMPVTGDSKGQRATVPHLFQFSSVATPSCAGSALDRPVTGCSDPIGGAASQIELMRQVVFPPDPSLRLALRTRLQDRTLDAAQRLAALESLRAARVVVVPGPTAPRATAELQNIDVEALRGALDLASTASDPSLRKQVWGELRGVRRPELAQALIDAFQLEGSDPVRLEMVTILAADYAGDAKGRAALESISRNDPREIVRRVARRSLAGDSSWNEYVARRLQDAQLADTQRLEALMYMAGSDQGQQLRAMLDAKAVETLSRLVPRMLATLPPPAARSADADDLPRLINHIAASNQPASVDLLVGILNQASDPEIRRTAVVGLARHLDSARAREMLEDIAAHDPDPALRDQAKVAQPQLLTPPPGT